MPNESGELQAIRELLASLEKHLLDDQGVLLSEDLSELVTEIAEEGYASEREERVLANLLRTYATLAEKEARGLLADFDSASDETALFLQHVMQQMVRINDSLPGSFHEARMQLLEGITERMLRQLLSPPKRSGDHGPFVASQWRPHFHRLECIWATYITDPVEYETHEEAVDSGKKPCKTCRA